MGETAKGSVKGKSLLEKNLVLPGQSVNKHTTQHTRTQAPHHTHGHSYDHIDRQDSHMHEQFAPPPPRTLVTQPQN